MSKTSELYAINDALANIFERYDILDDTTAVDAETGECVKISEVDRAIELLNMEFSKRIDEFVKCYSWHKDTAKRIHDHRKAELERLRKMEEREERAADYCKMVLGIMTNHQKFGDKKQTFYSASWRCYKDKVDIVESAMVPDEYKKPYTTMVPDKEKIKAAKGDVPGVKVHDSWSLTVR